MYYYLTALVTILVVYGIRILHRLWKNITIARAIGLPVVIVPIDQHHLLWLLVSPICRPYLQRTLPTPIWERLSLVIRGWEFHEKLRPFDQRSAQKGIRERSYVLVGLRSLEFWTADPEAADEVLHRVRDFEVPRALGFALGQYGPNVLTANGDQWVRHRRIITSVMDERLFRNVFEESQQQTLDLLDEVHHSSEISHLKETVISVETVELFDKMKRITIHVLLRSVMGVEVPWKGSDNDVTESDFRMTHEKSLAVVVTNLAGLGLLPTKVVTNWPAWIPGYRVMSWVGYAKLEVHKRSKQLLDQELHLDRRRLRNHRDDSSVCTRSAGTISSLAKLAARGIEHARPIEQEEETNDKGTESSYLSIFPQAKRITAFMMETVRLFSPVPHMHRECEGAQEIRTSTGAICLPAHTRVYFNAIALHLLPVWRDINRHADPTFVSTNTDRESLDEYAFRPSRWINAESADHAIYRPPKGTFVPWAMSPRVCPGQKMAQVEFVAVISTLLRRHRIEAVQTGREDREDLEQLIPAHLIQSAFALADGHGVVVEAGPGCTLDLLGKSVVLTPCRGWGQSPDGPEDWSQFSTIGGTGPHHSLGAAQHFVVVQESEVEPCPDHLSAVEGAALPSCGLTAWRALVAKSGNAQPGRNILVTGIGGGVALQILQFGVALGCNIYVTSSSADKIQRAQALGAKAGVIYKNDEWPKELLGMLPAERPFLDAVIDGAGGDIVIKAITMLKPGGIISSYGMTRAPVMDWPMQAVLKNIELRGSTLGSRTEFTDMVKFVGQKQIRPIVCRTVKGLDCVDAIDGLFDELKAGKQFGKLVIEL
ncbi:putative Cytochrome P450 [Seiridium cardinale]|uniref:Cytochrome P450 n=1 Tax=Seiridium cardinale TaxID=138064 RepID=A0ABR2Y9J3_9PEZI